MLREINLPDVHTHRARDLAHRYLFDYGEFEDQKLFCAHFGFHLFESDIENIFFHSASHDASSWLSAGSATLSKKSVSAPSAPERSKLPLREDFLRKCSVMRERMLSSSQPLNKPTAGSYLKPRIFRATAITVSCKTSCASASFSPALTATL